MFSIKPTRIPRLAIAFLIISALVGGLLLTVPAAPAEDHYAQDHSAGKRAVVARDSASEDVVIATVGTERITLSEFAEALNHLQYMKDLAQRELNGLIEQNPSTIYLKGRQDIANYWGDDNVALVDLVHESVLHQEALALGLSVSDHEIQENVELARMLFEKGEIDPYNKGYAESMGMERYWSEYPQKAERSLLISKLHQHVASEDGSFTHSGTTLAWHEFLEAALSDADITLIPSEHHNATLEGILGHLASVRELDRSHALQTHVPKAPENKWVVYIKREGADFSARHIDVEPQLCPEVGAGSDDSGGGATLRLCDADTGELLVESRGIIAYIVVPPGEVLPKFTED